MIGIQVIIPKTSQTEVNLQVNHLLENYTFGLNNIQAEAFYRIFKPYSSYPIQQFRAPNIHIIVEGVLLQAATHFNLIVDVLLKESNNTSTLPIAIEKALKATQMFSGEWAIWIFTPTNFYFANDSMGRLPVYFYQNEAFVFWGRSIAELKEKVDLRPCANGILSYLWSGYPIGDYTLFEGVSRINGGSIYSYNYGTQKYTITANNALLAPIGDEKATFETFTELVDLFKEGCSLYDTTGFQSKHISLSGGQDSRAVFAGINTAALPIFASSFLNGGSQADVEVAKKIAEIKAVELQAIPVTNSTLADKLELLCMKQGLNYVGMAFILPYLKQVCTLPNSLMLTGDGGDKVMPFLGENATIRSTDHLVELLLKRHAVNNLPAVLQLLGVSIDDLKQLIYKLLLEWGTDTLQHKACRFVLTQRAAKAYFEGEDRNRYFMWSSTPFYYKPFYNLAMSINQNEKKHYKFYKQFMLQLDPVVCQIPDANGYAINSTGFYLKKRMQETLRSSNPIIKSSLRFIYHKLSGYKPNAALPIISQSAQNQFDWLNSTKLKDFEKRTNQEGMLYLETIIRLFS